MLGPKTASDSELSQGSVNPVIYLIFARCIVILVCNRINNPPCFVNAGIQNCVQMRFHEGFFPILGATPQVKTPVLYTVAL